VSLSFRRISLLAALALLAAFAPLARPALAANYVVSSLADSGAGTLRQAITNANASAGQDTITFSVAGKITISSLLPGLTDTAGVIIDGRNGSGAPTIELSGSAGVADGIAIYSKDNIIRGLIINSFSSAGVDIYGATSTNNLIEQNYIGTNPAGTAAGSAGTNNTKAGVFIQFGASNNTINNNVISGNKGFGVYIHTVFSSSATAQQGNTITNNRIGVTADGSAALGNGQEGVYIGDNSNSTTVGPGNVISANGTLSTTAAGVVVSGKLFSNTAYINGNRVIGNKVGTNAAGTAALPNRAGGVYIGKSVNTAVGGPTGNAGTPGGDGNLVSGNTTSGLIIQDDSATGSGITSLVVQNNWIGVNATGNAALQNTDAGVLIWKQASGVTIGPNNVISGNKFDGVQLYGARNQTDPTKQTRNNLVTGNIIGAGANGTTAVPNGSYGVDLFGGTTGNTINGNNRILKNTFAGIYFEVDDSTPTPLQPSNTTISGNTITGNGQTGIAVLVGSATTIGPGNTISGHTNAGIEIQTSQNTVKGNTISGNLNGINITNAAKNNTIGGPSPSDGNNLANNTQNGVLVSGAGTTGNKITHTTTNANGGKGIALTGGGNLGDQPNRPGLSGLSINANSLSGTVTNGGNCGGSCTIEVFTDSSSQTDEGPFFVTSFTSAGSFSNISIAGCKPFLIFTVTDSAGNTSEFTSPIAAPSGSCVPAAPAVSISTNAPGASRGVVPGSSTTYQHTVTNSGTGAGAVSISFSQSANGWATLINNTCLSQTLNPGGTCTFAVQVSVPGGTPAGQSNVATINVNIGSATGQQVDTTTALANPALAFTPNSQTKSTGSGQPVSFTHILTNTGNGPDSFNITVTPPSGWSFSVLPANPIALAQGASTIVTVTYTPPSGIASPPNYTATVRASSNAAPSVFKDVTDTITVTTAAVPQISSVVTPSSVDPGNTVNVTYTITNAGNISGTFNLVLTKPAGWTATPPTLTPVSIASGTSTTVNISLQVPANAIAGPYSVSLTATATTTPFATATKTNQITVKQKAALAWSPDLGPFSRPPNQTFTDTLTLTNNGNFTDTVSLVASSSRGWSVQPIPSNVTLNPGQSKPIDVRMIIPAGQIAGVSNTTTVTATSQLPATKATAHITTTIAAVAGVTLTPKLQQKTIDAGKPMTFTFTLQNSGSIAQAYTIANTASPAGWTSTLTPLTTPSLLPGQTQLITFTLKAPAGTPDGTVGSVDITATCAAACSATATAKLTIGPPFGVGTGGVCNGPALPGAIVTCVHTITNAGSTPDNYVLTALSPLGWRTTISPPSVFLDPGASQTITVTLAVPTSADAGLQHVLQVKARSTAAPAFFSQLTDTTTVMQVGGVSFSPSRSAPLAGPQLLQFQHTVLNTGNGLDSYTITATQDLNWSITIVPTQTQALPRGTYQPILVQVQVPPGLLSVTVNRITLRATSTFTPTVYDELIDTVGTFGAPGVQYHSVFLPAIFR
jgi:parallel beta-helix repeat protein